MTIRIKMNKLPHEQNTPVTAAEQDGTDFYARITPMAVKAASRSAPPEAKKLAVELKQWNGEWARLSRDAMFSGLLHMLEQAERRAAEADRAARKLV